MELTHATVAALPLVARTAVVALREAGADQAHLAALAETIHRLRDQAGHLMVDRDRGVREAGRRALDCEVHGTQLQELEGQVARFSQKAERNDRARVVLLGLAHELERADPKAKWSGVALKAAARNALEAHRRAWR